MAIHKDRHYDKFVQMHNYIARSTALSLRGKGLLSLLLSYPETWKFNVNSLARDCKESVTAIRTALNELIKAGYVERIRKRTSSGQFDYEFNVYETPQTESDEPSVSKPEEKEPPVKKDTIQNPDLDSPLTENPQTDSEPPILYNNKKRVTKKDSQRESEKFASLKKQKFGKYKNISLTPDEYKSLTERYGKDQTDRSIEVASEYGHMNGRRYAYERMDKWIRQDTEKADSYGENDYKKPKSHKSRNFDVSEYERVCVNNYNVVGYDSPTGEEIKKREEEKKRKEEEEWKRREQEKEEAHFKEMLDHIYRRASRTV